jgi:hypothetical protein
VQSAGVTDDPARGHIVVDVFNCDSDAGVGVSLSVDIADAQSTVGYVGTSGQVEPALTETTELGRVIIFNVPPGDATISATIVATGDALPTRSVQVRAAALSFIGVDATPEAM